MDILVVYIVNHVKWSIPAPYFTPTYFSTGKTPTKLSCKMSKKCHLSISEEFPSTWCHAYLSSQDWNIVRPLNEMRVSLHILMVTYSPTHQSLKLFICAKDLLLWGQLQWRKGSQDWDWETPPSLSLHCCSRSCRSIRPCRGTCERLDLAWAPSGGAPGTLPDWTDPQTLCSGH